MKSRHLDDSLRHYISMGTLIPREKVYPGMDEGIIDGGIFASVTPFADAPFGTPSMIDVSQEGIILESGQRTRSYSISIHRDGAFDAALRFDQWRQSNEGITSAEQAMIDGKIWRSIIYNSGDGCKKTSDFPDVIFSSPRDSGQPGYREAKGTAQIQNGHLVNIIMVDNGNGFTDNVPTSKPSEETSNLSSIQFLFDYESIPLVSSSGIGFAIKNVSSIRDIGSNFSGEYEESSSFEMSIIYEWVIQRDTRFMEEREGFIGTEQVRKWQL